MESGDKKNLLSKMRKNEVALQLHKCVKLNTDSHSKIQTKNRSIYLLVAINKFLETHNVFSLSQFKIKYILITLHASKDRSVNIECTTVY